jgi:hypothetical protein
MDIDLSSVPAWVKAVAPKVRVLNSATPDTSQLMRHGKYFSPQNEKYFYWAYPDEEE